MRTLNVRNIILAVAISITAYSCQKELYNPNDPTLSPTKPLTKYVRTVGDTFFIRAFYGHQGITPPGVGTIVFPQYAYDVPAVNKLAFMSAYTGLNGYGDSANTLKKNAINMYNGELYNDNSNAQGNAWITLTPINHPTPDYSSVSSDGKMAYDKFFTKSKQILISVKLVKGNWEHCDTSANGQITIYQMDKLNMVAQESVETGLATQNNIQKLKNGQSETYLGFVNQKGLILQPSKNQEGKVVIWHPSLIK
jgi:hypothetical protein